MGCHVHEEMELHLELPIEEAAALVQALDGSFSEGGADCGEVVLSSTGGSIVSMDSLRPVKVAAAVLTQLLVEQT